ncbi:asparagine synthase (glutamine-hydrolyzing) [Shewanella sp. OMA3-2]|uniref:asparagine synthase (glutamine-hydrolyzing) n=1 Tax=Shewanella sp. OMA3-2 TaxID=2908650 RepID=UPI001F1E0E4A|nr:asparagine synthase (glutamine-hydrolyzing) [Shewanella sp. OMA3-2]UJF23373.1 asparagine synthase (glutamine-hydrolyzing) [Shewanella sp. OMA3-2]
MCGIAGAVNIPFVKDQLNIISHRGPDSSGFHEVDFENSKLYLGHTRLSILDTSSAGAQPMFSLCNRWLISFNGEIYNHIELRKLLNIDFTSSSDTQTLVELISIYGVEDTCKKLNGMFSFCAVDLENGELYLVRDNFGIKPIYYYSYREQFAFSSEVKFLTRELKIKPEVSRSGIEEFFSIRFVASPNTLLSNIKRVKPGSIIKYDINKGVLVDEKQFISLKENKFEGSIEDAVSQYQVKLQTAVKRQLLSDVPVGMLLSGGVDSALVAAMAADSGHKLPCYSVGFGDGFAECELSNARHTAAVLGLDFNEVLVSPDDLLDSFINIAKTIEEPLGTTSILPMWSLVHAAKKDVSVVLTGQGTDEPWGGYNKYQVEIVRNFFKNSGFWQAIKFCSPSFMYKNESFRRAIYSLAANDVGSQVIHASSLFSESDRYKLCGTTNSGNLNETLAFWCNWAKQGKLTQAELMMQVDSRMSLADDLLLYADKLSMHVSLETRVPMLDVDLVEFVESLPLNYKVKFKNGKLVHKLMAEKYLPSSIVHRKKLGFHVPFSTWSKSIWKGFIEDHLLSENLPHFNYINRSAVLDIWTRHQSGNEDLGKQIFSLLMFSLWSQEYDAK